MWMKFLADGMLGKLTRWLRILGQDVKYSSILSDEELIVLAKKERRAILTRDFELYQKTTANRLLAFYIEGEDNAEQLARISKQFAIQLEFNIETSRCPKCNGKLRSVPKAKIAGKVQKNTFDHYKEFWRCPKCRQIYWHGAHWGRIQATLKNAESKLKLF
jgi:hypothetical protein